MMKTFTSGVRKNSFWKRLSGENQSRSPTRLAPLSPTVKPPRLLRRVLVPDDRDVARIADAEPSSCATRMYSIESGIVPHHLRGDRVDRDLVLDASITFFTTGRIVRGPGPSPAVVPSITAKSPVWISFWIASRSTSVRWIHECV
jgi:hypothetical protein